MVKKFQRLGFLFILLLMCILPSIGSAEIRGVVREMRKGVMMPSPAATVLVGKNLWIQKKGGVDVVMGKVVAETTTDEIGKFIVPLEKKGTYSMLIWKHGFDAALFNDVANPGVMPAAYLNIAIEGEALILQK